MVIIRAAIFVKISKISKKVLVAVCSNNILDIFCRRCARGWRTTQNVKTKTKREALLVRGSTYAKVCLSKFQVPVSGPAMLETPLQNRMLQWARIVPG